jgi:hypothetical protein
MIDLKKKLSNPYKVRTVEKAVKDVDLDKRTVSGIFNSSYYIDSDLDMLLPGAASKSISERGVGSTKGNKIKHLKDHDWRQNIAVINVLDERAVTIDGKEINGIYHESYYPESTDSTDLLIKIQAGLYDARSIGFQYEKMVFCARDSDNEDNVKNWNTYLPMALNPEVAEEAGYFWTVKEIRLWEGSDVSFGANELTPLLDMKGVSKDLIVKQLFEKLDVCHKLFKDGDLSDDGFHKLDMEIKQIKAYITSFNELKPSKKHTKDPSDPKDPSRETKDTSSKDFYKTLLTGL